MKCNGFISVKKNEAWLVFGIIIARAHDGMLDYV